MGCKGLVLVVLRETLWHRFWVNLPFSRGGEADWPEFLWIELMGPTTFSKPAPKMREVRF